ncbi:MAG TPA: nitrogen fixation protein FixH [Caldimonas sp.]|nr:nitrogen fixation protein FixH [Caldimonas sp.]
MSTTCNESASGPWWRHGMVWLVISGPLAVVVASFVSAGIAVHGADRVLPQGGQPGHRQAAEEVETPPATTPEARTAPTAPAVLARNHAAAAAR